MKHPSIVFDLDGTLVDSSKRHYAVYIHIVQILNGQPVPFHTYWRLKRRKISLEHLFQLSSVVYSKTNIDYYLHSFATISETDKFLKLDSSFPSIHHVLQTLAQKNELSLVTLRRNAALLMEQLSHLNLDKYFTYILHDSPDSREPHRIKTHLLNKVNINPALIIGDTEADILTARIFQIPSIGVLTGIRNKSTLATYKPTHIAANSKQILLKASQILGNYLY